MPVQLKVVVAYLSPSLFLSLSISLCFIPSVNLCPAVLCSTTAKTPRSQKSLPTRLSTTKLLTFPFSLASCPTCSQGCCHPSPSQEAHPGPGGSSQLQA